MIQSNAGTAAGAVFDRLAPTYDVTFTNSIIGRAQRNAVWKVLLKTFQPHDNILELNCGTGEDALFLGAHNISVFACDASQQMIAQASKRLRKVTPAPPVVLCHLPTERIASLSPEIPFDGVFSNFSGLNCVEDLASVAASLAPIVKHDGRLLLCFSTRFCLFEAAYFFAHRRFSKGIRRWKGSSRALLEGAPLTVFYPTLKQICSAFAPHFKLCSVRGIGVFIPPSYLELWARRSPSFFAFLCRLEELVSVLPALRTGGDHMLICFKRVNP